MNKLKILTALIFVFILSSCSSNKFVELNDSSDCNTTIEGNFISPQVYKYYSPAVLFSKSSKYNVKYGKVIKEDSGGVFFLEKQSGLFGGTDTLYIKYPEIRAIVDSNKNCVWGSLKDNEKAGVHIKIFLQKVDEPKYEPIFIDLTPGKNFKYCVHPGKYEITKVTKENPDESKEIYDMSVSDSIGEFEVKPGVVNYIGDLKLLKNDSEEKPALIVPYKEQSTGSSAGAVGGLLGGAIGGAIAGAITASANADDAVAGSFRFGITFNPDYKSITNNVVEKCRITLFK
jgi:hypothetical protein